MNNPLSRPATRLASLTLCAAAILAGGSAEAATAPKGLYGDPAHPDISGMWNPAQLVQFGITGTYGPGQAVAGAAVAPINAFGPGSGGPPGAGGPPGGGPPRAGPPGGGAGRAPPPAGPKLTPKYAGMVAEVQKRQVEGDPLPDYVTRCLAFGPARFMTMPMEVIQTPGQVTLNLGVLHDIRRIYLNGHTQDADPSYNGDGAGHWEGDTLVVDINNIRGGGNISLGGVPYSDKLTMTERWRRVSPTQLQVVQVLTDPEAFTEPYTIVRDYTAMPPGARFEEYVCENNQDANGAGGLGDK